ncbi:phage holin family protein [Robertmurraya yapensis]|uniref:Phage holin family protein n=1 Tax=Bacillus yapensis TaxID=2492960 RepID=A0A3S0IKK9_9BACI|nr:phage holin family protein [Bacillus yapensis]RTR36278.1 phage holin family protein [Bacillus yapensis]TKT05781.1 phage holin family protein [Bacillus yapensis]
MKWILGILINAVLFIALAGYFGDSFYIEGFGAAVGASIVLAILNILVRPILIILTLPITLVSLGLFLFVINGVTLLLTDAIIGDAFEISGLGMAIFISAIMSIINLVIQNFILDKKKEK